CYVLGEMRRGGGRRGPTGPAPASWWLRSGGAARADPRGAQHAILHRVAGLHDERDRGGLDVVGGLVHEGLVAVRVELLAHRAEARQAVRAEHLLELLRDGVEGGALHDVAVLAAQLEVVEDPDEGAEDASDRRLLAHLGRGLDPSARVDVLGLIALELLG